MVLEQTQELLQVTHVAGQTIQPVHDDHIDAASRYIRQQRL